MVEKFLYLIFTTESSVKNKAKIDLLLQAEETASYERFHNRKFP